MRKPVLALLLGLVMLAGCLQPSGGRAAAAASPATTATVTMTTTVTAAPAPPALPPTPRIGHVAILVLENENYETTFPAHDPPSPELAVNLTAQGRLLTQYYGIGHASADNYLAMVSGQAPNPLTQGDCAAYVDFVGTTGGPDGQAIGQGCVYPPEVLTIGGQLQAAGGTWRMYAEDMANVDAPKTCRHQPVDSQDTWQGESADDQFATRHVPFVYFHSVIDDQASCDAHVVDLSALPADLADANRTPQLVFITPDVCSDGHDATCMDPKQRGGYGGIEDFLKAWVPRILGSPAFQKDGLLVVTFDEAEASTPDACCNEQAGYNTPRPGISGMGGGRVGAVLLGPCIPPGTTDTTPYNHYSLLRTVEDLFGVDHLGYAGQAGLKPIDLGACSPRLA